MCPDSIDELPALVCRTAGSLQCWAETGGTPAVSKGSTCSGQSTLDLLLEHFFDLSDFLLNFAGVFFGVAFGL
jgi:hypothetical protein